MLLLARSVSEEMSTRKPFVVPALAGLLPFRLKAVQQTAQPLDSIFS